MANTTNTTSIKSIVSGTVAPEMVAIRNYLKAESENMNQHVEEQNAAIIGLQLVIFDNLQTIIGQIEKLTSVINRVSHVEESKADRIDLQRHAIDYRSRIEKYETATNESRHDLSQANSLLKDIKAALISATEQLSVIGNTYLLSASCPPEVKDQYQSLMTGLTTMARSLDAYETRDKDLDSIVQVFPPIPDA